MVACARGGVKRPRNRVCVCLAGGSFCAQHPTCIGRIYEDAREYSV